MWPCFSFFFYNVMNLMLMFDILFRGMETQWQCLDWGPPIFTFSFLLGVSHFLFLWGGIFIFSWSPKLADPNDKLLDCFRQESLINMGFSFYHELHSLKIKIKCSHGMFSIFKWDESSVDGYYMIEGVGNPVMMFVLMCLFSHFLLFLKNILLCWGFSHSFGYLS